MKQVILGGRLNFQPTDHQLTINQKSSLSATMKYEKNVIYHSSLAYLTQNSLMKSMEEDEMLHVIDKLQFSRTPAKQGENSAPLK